MLRAPRATSVDVPDGNQCCVLPHQSTKSARCLLREDSAEIKKKKEVKVVPEFFVFSTAVEGGVRDRTSLGASFFCEYGSHFLSHLPL